MLRTSAKSISNLYKQADEVQTSNFAGAFEKEERISISSTNSSNKEAEPEKTSVYVSTL